MEPESSLPYSQVPATCPYPEPARSSPHNPLPLPEDGPRHYEDESKHGGFISENLRILTTNNIPARFVFGKHLI